MYIYNVCCIQPRRARVGRPLALGVVTAMKTPVLRGTVTIGLLSALLVSGGGRLASAGDPAEEHIERGLELRRQDQPEAALAELEKAHALQPSGRTLAQIAFAEQSLGRWT